MYCSNRHWVRRPTTRAHRYRIIEAAPTAMATTTRPAWIAAAERRLAGAPDVVEEAPRAASAAAPPSPRVPETAAPVVTEAALEAEYEAALRGRLGREQRRRRRLGREQRRRPRRRRGAPPPRRPGRVPHGPRGGTRPRALPELPARAAPAPRRGRVGRRPGKSACWRGRRRDGGGRLLWRILDTQICGSAAKFHAPPVHAHGRPRARAAPAPTGPYSPQVRRAR